VLATALIVLPVAAALVVASTCPPRDDRGARLLRALMEVGLWIVTAARYDYSAGRLQLGTSHEWVEPRHLVLGRLRTRSG
jgi:NADH:ubiquinone oxidoreductase subunit 4 (subunit M)